MRYLLFVFFLSISTSFWAQNSVTVTGSASASAGAKNVPGADEPDTATYRVLNFSNLNNSFGTVGDLGFIQRTGALIRKTSTGWNEVVNLEDGRKATSPQTTTTSAYTPGLTYSRASISTSSDAFSFVNPTTAITGGGVYLFQVTNGDGTADVISFGTNYVGPDGNALTPVTVPALQTATFEFQVGTLGANTMLRLLGGSKTGEELDPSLITGLDSRDTVLVEFNDEIQKHPGAQFASGFEWDKSTNSNSNPYMEITIVAANELPDTEEDGAIRVVNNVSGGDISLSQTTGNVNGGASYTLGNGLYGLFRYDLSGDDWEVIELGSGGSNTPVINFGNPASDGNVVIGTESAVSGVFLMSNEADSVRLSISNSGFINITPQFGAMQALRINSNQHDYFVVDDQNKVAKIGDNLVPVSVSPMTNTERDALSATASSLVFSTTDSVFYVYTHEWVPIGTAGVSDEGTGTVNAEKFKENLVDVSSGTATVNPPGSPSEGDWFVVIDSRANAGTNNITVDFVSAGDNHHGASQNSIINSDFGVFKYVYKNPTLGWLITY